jgi:hypothetical protein
MATLKAEKVVRQWGTIIERGAGRDKWVLDHTQTLIREACPPTVVLRREPVSTGMFSEKREFLIVTHNAIREYAMFINAQNFGQDLSVSWYLTVNPGFLKRAISKKIRSDPNALSLDIPVFAQQDISAFVQTAHNRLRGVVEELNRELQQDYSRIDWQPKGILSMW